METVEVTRRIFVMREVDEPAGECAAASAVVVVADWFTAAAEGGALPEEEAGAGLDATARTWNNDDSDCSES